MPQHGSSTYTFWAASPSGDAEVVLERLVHARDHVPHHLGRCVPHAELLSQRGIELFEERLVEVLHGLALVEPLEERLPVHAVERVGGPVQHLDEAQRLELAGIGELLEQRPENRRAQMPHGQPPVEL